MKEEASAGSVRLLDAAVCRQRRVSFMPFNVLEGFEETPGRATRLRAPRKLGFAPCFFYMSTSPLTVPELTDAIVRLRQYAEQNHIPIDGIVVRYTSHGAFADSLNHKPPACP